MKPYLLAFLTLAFLVSGGCWASNEEPQGLRLTEESGGPRVSFDLDERPFPDIPFPNDIATRVDPHSPTGLRLNVSELGASQAEERVRAALNESSGFGVFSPLTVSFDQPLDIEELIARHQQLTPDFSDDAIYLVNVDPESPTYGKLELLDMGLGNFPITLSRPDRYFDNDSRADGTNLLYPTADHHGGIPNLRDSDANPWDFGQVLDFYERETNTLVMRPVHALEPGTTYAVVLTSTLRGENSHPVESPFRWINHLDQSESLEPLRQILPDAYPERFDPSLENIRFAWSFTTQVPTERLEAIRAGLYGHGPLAWLNDDFPAELQMLHQIKSEGSEAPLTFDLESILPLIIPIANDQLGPEGTAIVREAFEDIDYVVSGTFLSPNFLGEQDGLFNEDLVSIDLAKGTADLVTSEVPFMCTVPVERGQYRAPFPTIIYSHAISSTRFEMLAFAGAMAKFGFAMCTIDAAGHGISIPSEFEGIVDNIGPAQGLDNLGDVIKHHRARDLTNNGALESGGDYFTADVLHSRDMIVQTAVDQMQLVRILRSFDGELRFPDSIDEEDPFIIERRHMVAGWDQTGDGNSEIAGDFNGNGSVDFGGNRPYTAWGTSLGGIQATVLSAIEPTIVAGASNAGGGGLADISVRTTIGNVRSGVTLRMMGPLLVGNPMGANTRITWILPNADNNRRVFLAEVPMLEDGDRVILRNLTREDNFLVPFDETRGEDIVDQGRFRVGVAADASSPPVRRQQLGFDSSIDLYTDIMGCVESSRCGESRSCDDGSYCAPDNSCQPLHSCRGNFDPDLIDEDLAHEYERRIVTDAIQFGDPLIVEIRNSRGEIKHRIDTFEEDIIDQNMIYAAGTPLAALGDGWGLTRQTPRFRSFVGLAQTLLEPADPSVWSPHFFLRPLEFPYESEEFQRGATNFLTIGTLGDQTVPIGNAIAIARTAGVVGTLETDPRYGMTENQFLIENFVYEGISGLNRFPDYPNSIFDPDNLDEGRWRPNSEPDNTDPKPVADDPLRAVVQTESGVSALRFGYLSRRGTHTFNAPDPSQPFDIHSFLTNQVGFFLATGGTEISDDHCQQDLMMRDCSFFSADTFTNPL